MIKYILCVISIVLVIIDAIIFLNFKRYIKEHENELIEKHNKSLLARMIAMVIISILVGVIGVQNLCITSDGRKYDNPKILEKQERKQIVLCHEKIRNTRKDYLHKISHEIISENQVIVTENLQIKNMSK